MPVMSGLDAAPAIRKTLPHVQLILFTIHEELEIETLARTAGIDAVVAKTYAASRLIPQAKALLGMMR
jgi:CheY-like chemotaxis protein